MRNNIFTKNGKTYVNINGTDIELTKEQVKEAGLTTPYDKMGFKIGESIYHCADEGSVKTLHWNDDCTDQIHYENANMFNNKAIATQVMLHQLLYRKLLKYAYENKAEVTNWDETTEYYSIAFEPRRPGFEVYTASVYKQQGAVYFSDILVAENAIADVVVPFMEEHPDFVW